MRRSPLRPAILAAAIAVLLVGCGSSSDEGGAGDEPTTTTAKTTVTTAAETSETTEAGDVTTTTRPAADGDAICGPLKDLGDSDAAANELVASGDWPAIQTFYVEESDDILAIYDEAIALDTEITPELETLRAVTVSSADLAARSTSLMDYGSKLLAEPGLSESGAATIRVNEFAEETCGFALSTF